MEYQGYDEHRTGEVFGHKLPRRHYPRKRFRFACITWLEKSKIQSVTMTHEPAVVLPQTLIHRINGLGLGCVTYCVGGLNILNAMQARRPRNRRLSS